jgi:glutamate transport system ATP-binding protein
MHGAAPPPLISTAGVNKHFGSLQVLKDIDLEVDRGPTSG